MLNFIPISALTGVMAVVVTHTFKWTSLIAVARAFLPAGVQRALGCRTGGGCTVPCCGEVPELGRFDALVVIVVSVLTVYTNIAYSVIGGLVLAHGRAFLAERGWLGSSGGAGLAAADAAKGTVEMSPSAADASERHDGFGEVEAGR